MGIRDHARAAKTSDSGTTGNHLKQGKGIFIVKRLKWNKGHKGESFAAEFFTESSQSYPNEIDQSKDAKPGTIVEANPPGSIVSSVLSFSGDPEKVGMMHKNMGILIYSLIGATSALMDQAAAATEAAMRAAGIALPQQPDGTFAWTGVDEYANLLEYLVCEDITGSKVVKTTTVPNGQDKVNPAAGMRIGYSTAWAKTKKSGMITVPVWQTLQNTPESIADGLRKLAGQ